MLNTFDLQKRLDWKQLDGSTNSRRDGSGVNGIFWKTNFQNVPRIDATASALATKCVVAKIIVAAAATPEATVVAFPGIFGKITRIRSTCTTYSKPISLFPIQLQ